MRAKLIAAIGFLLAGFVLLAGSAPAAAHGAHRPSTSANAVVHVDGSAGSIAQADCAARWEKVGSAHSQCDLASGPEGPAQPAHEGTCCCGSVLCHTGVAIAILSDSSPYDAGEKIELPLVIVSARHMPGGIERPPRAAAL
jgi:hypothetical protein